MDDLGARTPGFPRRGMVLGVLVALPAMVALWGFTVDDALIPARYATHIAHGLGYRFNAHGASTDGVTPLGWAYVLAPFAARGPLAALAAARWIGVAAWLVAAAALGAAVEQVKGASWRYASLALVLGSAPLGAWACAGLETGVVVALSTAAAVLPFGATFAIVGAAAIGACAWLRPEMIAMAIVLGAARSTTAERPATRVASVAAAVGPWCAAAAIRWAIWGRPAPLAVLSKPSDLVHGLIYVGSVMALSGAPLAALAPVAYRRLPTWPRVLAAGAFLHLVAVAIAGGDWMPLARLACPALPLLVIVAAHLLADPKGWLFARLRLGIACAGEVSVFALRGPRASQVLRDRTALIEAARPWLAHADRIATIDVGWVGACSEADLIDLAGATDPEVAALPGGHTSKAVSGAFLTGRRPDRLVFEMTSPLASGDVAPTFARTTEARLGTDPIVRRTYELLWTSPRELSVQYAILGLRAASPPIEPNSD